MRWDELTAICAAMTVIGGVGIFVVRATVTGEMGKMRQWIEDRFASKDRVDGIEHRLGSLEGRHGD